jgi:F0F1-type ATP synthase membrane subunit b/b'
MSADDFNQAKYTDAAWSAIASLTKAAEFHQSSNVEAPLMLDLLLNPKKHNAGDDAEAARKVVERILTQAQCNVSDLRRELDDFLARQAKISADSGAQKTMGRSLQAVLDGATQVKSVLGVSCDSRDVMVDASIL